MSEFKNRVLCPIDMSDTSLAAIPLATTIARENRSTLVFLYVAPQWLPEESMVGSDYIRNVIDENKARFEKLRPAHHDVDFDHRFLHGNAGPEIVKESEQCDMVVMTTHGYSGVLRFLVGSVAQYVMRNAKCPVVLIRIPDIQRGMASTNQHCRRYVTDVMHQVAPIRECDNINRVLADLDKAGETAAPVTNDFGTCIGILTKSDIDRYRSLLERYEKGDESVIDEMFEVDKYGHVRSDNHDFDQVKRHMSSPVVTIDESESIDKAIQMFAENQTIHHLVVVDENNHALGILEPVDCQRPTEIDVPPEPQTKP